MKWVGFVIVLNFHPGKTAVTQLEVVIEQDLTVNLVHPASSPAKQQNPCPLQTHMAGRMQPFTSWGGKGLGVVVVAGGW